MIKKKCKEDLYVRFEFFYHLFVPTKYFVLCGAFGDKHRSGSQSAGILFGFIYFGILFYLVLTIHLNKVHNRISSKLNQHKGKSAYDTLESLICLQKIKCNKIEIYCTKSKKFLQKNFLLTLTFEEPFHGIVYSERGFPKCVYVNASVLSQQYYAIKVFRILSNNIRLSSYQSIKTIRNCGSIPRFFIIYAVL